MTGTWILPPIFDISNLSETRRKKASKVQQFLAYENAVNNCRENRFSVVIFSFVVEFQLQYYLPGIFYLLLAFIFFYHF